VVSPSIVKTGLPVGVLVRDLDMNADDRGCFTEIFRREWETGVEPVQWNAVSSAAGVLRGVHVHLVHWDYLVVVQGSAMIGLSDLRRGAAESARSATIELRGERLQGVSIPPGVAHGFYFREPSVHIYAVSEYWSSADELGCHWAEEGLDIDWPSSEVQLSERDHGLPTLQKLRATLEPHQPIVR